MGIGVGVQGKPKTCRFETIHPSAQRPEVYSSLGKILTNFGHQISVAEEAIGRLPRLNYSLFLSDLHLMSFELKITY